MTCKDCIHSGLCYKENDYDNFPDRCGSFIPERPQGEWTFDEKGNFYCDKCGKYPHDQYATTDFCPKCGADMRKGGEE